VEVECGSTAVVALVETLCGLSLALDLPRQQGRIKPRAGLHVLERYAHRSLRLGHRLSFAVRWPAAAPVDISIEPVRARP
jgi:hypothetical protein